MATGPGTYSWWLRALDAVAGVVLWPLERLIPKDPSLVLLAAHRDRMETNIGLLFVHLAADGRFRVRGVFRDKASLRAARTEHGRSVVRAGSPRSLWLQLRASAFLYSHSVQDMWPLGRWLRRPRYVYINHGIPLKRMGLSKKQDVGRFAAREAQRMAHGIACSPDEAGFWADAFGLDPGDIWVTGAPRNALLRKRHPEVEADLPPGLRILYAPTFREWDAPFHLRDVPGMDVERLEATLARLGATLLVRPHYYVRQETEPFTPHVQLADRERFPDANRLLPSIDVLVTDYSSIYLDFLLLDRPIVFLAHDRDAYEADRGFYFDYDANTPGPKVADLEGLLAALERACLQPDADTDARARVRRRFHAFTDGEAASRIAERLITDCGLRPLR